MYIEFLQSVSLIITELFLVVYKSYSTDNLDTGHSYVLYCISQRNMFLIETYTDFFSICFLGSETVLFLFLLVKLNVYFVSDYHVYVHANYISRINYVSYLRDYARFTCYYYPPRVSCARQLQSFMLLFFKGTSSFTNYLPKTL